MPDDERPGHPDGATAVVRRAPFSDNPQVGARGQRTQQRILDAALRAFSTDGYHGCSVDRITTLAKCSRITFYQYFANKEDVFRQLAGQVARQVSASTERLDPLTSDFDGWTALRTWVADYAEIHARYEPAFHAYEGDEMLAAIARHTGDETLARIRLRLEAATLPPRRLEPVIRLLLECVNHTLDVTELLRAVAPEAYPSERVETALADVLHRTLFGVHPDVNVHDYDGPSQPALRPGPEMLERLRPYNPLDANASGNRVLDALLESGRDVFTARGYHTTRVDDVVEAAGVSHGAFYRYFRNKDQLARTLAAHAAQAVGTIVTEIPDRATVADQAGRNLLRRWLIRYHAAHANEAAMLQVWLDAALQAPALRAESAPLLDWGRRRMARYLNARGFGDVEIDAVVMVALFGVFGARPRPAAEIDATALVIERGLLGL
jgi:AcrR family transcriptional regulator